MHPDVHYFIILLCLAPNNSTCQGKTVTTQWLRVKPIYNSPANKPLLKRQAPKQAHKDHKQMTYITAKQSM
jgi:hypothetical protein